MQYQAEEDTDTGQLEVHIQSYLEYSYRPT